MTGSEGNEGTKGPSKFGIAANAWSTYSDLKKLMEGDPLGAVGLIGDAGKWAQLLIPTAIATPVIQGGLYTLTATSKTMGVGSPDSGDAFSDGAELFQSNGRSLEGAYPSETWSGSASKAYMSQNSHQIQRATTMLEADNDIVRILSTQAQQVDHARTEVDWASKGLAAMIPVAMALEASVLGAPESIALQLAAVVTASAFAGVAVGNLMNYARDNASQIQEAAAKYRRAGEVNDSSTDSPTPSSDSDNQIEPDAQENQDQPGTSGNQVEPESTENTGSPSSNGSTGSSSGSSGSSGSSPTTSSTPTNTTSGNTNTGSSTGTTSTPLSSQTGGMSSLPSMGSGSGGGGTGILGSLLNTAAQVAQSAVQAGQQTNQQDPNGQYAGGSADGQPAQDSTATSEDQPAAAPEQADAAAGPESGAGRAPVHISFDAGGTHTELALDPETTKGPVHVSLDPANPTAPPRITTDA